MTEQEKTLLLRVLCGYLPYGLMCDRLGKAYELVDVDIKRGLVYLLRDKQYVPYSIKNGDVVKPYLRPMDMNDEEIEKMWEIYENNPAAEGAVTITDFLNEVHLDHHYLIEKGLALPDTNGLYN